MSKKQQTSKTGQKMNCDLCDLVLPDQLSLTQHLAGKKHLTREKFKVFDRQVYVTGFNRRKANVQSLVEFFKGFGPVEKAEFFNNYTFAIVTFQANQYVKAAVLASNKVFLDGRRLYIDGRRMQMVEKKAPSNTNEDKLPWMQSLIKAQSFDEQLMLLLQRVRLSQEQVRSLSGLCIDLEHALQQKFPKAQAIPFGSMVSGLALQGSDVDCFILLDPQMRIEFGKNHDFFGHEVQSTLIKRTKSMLYRHNSIFVDIIAIPNAYIPIVKFVHKPSGYSCDLNFKNAAGIHNSSLIRFLLNTDPRLIPLFTFIKYWAKHHHITGVGRFSNYSIVMMVFYYLQQLSEPLIPAIDLLQQDSQYDVLHSGWNCGFSTDIPASKNTSDILTLLTGLLKFYAKFDFEFNVICPLVGKVIPKSSFAKTEELPPQFFRYVMKCKDQSIYPLDIKKFVIVQDPFEQQHNVTHGTSPTVAKYFQDHCNLAAVTIDEVLKSGKCNTVIQKLMEQKIILKKIGGTSFRREIPVPSNIINSANDSAPGTDAAVDVLAKTSQILNLIKDIVCRVMLGKWEENEKNNEDNVLGLKLFFKFNVWENRDKFLNKVTNKSSNILENEVKLSLLIKDTIYKDLVPDNSAFVCNLKITLRNESKSLQFHLDLIQGPKKSFKKVCEHLIYCIEKNI